MIDAVLRMWTLMIWIFLIWISIFILYVIIDKPFPSYFFLSSILHHCNISQVLSHSCSIPLSFIDSPHIKQELIYVSVLWFLQINGSGENILLKCFRLNVAYIFTFTSKYDIHNVLINDSRRKFTIIPFSQFTQTQYK